MDLHMHGLDDHFTLPQTDKVSASRPFTWLKLGWQDLRQHPLPSLGYGILIAIAGWLVLAISSNYTYLTSTSITGFMLLAPLGAAGIYELTSEREEGRETSFAQSIHDVVKNLGQIAFLGFILGCVAIGWERVSCILFALFYGGEAVNLHFFYNALFSEYWMFTVSWILGGFVLACITFAFTAVSIPMLADREVDVVTAMMTSLRVVMENLPAMVVWAAIIVTLTAIGFATGLLGLIVLFPLLGHATWIAYKELVH